MFLSRRAMVLAAFSSGDAVKKGREDNIGSWSEVLTAPCQEDWVVGLVD